MTERRVARPSPPVPALATEREAALVDLLNRARRNVAHSASHDHGFKSRALLEEIDAALAALSAFDAAQEGDKDGK